MSVDEKRKFSNWWLVPAGILALVAMFKTEWILQGTLFDIVFLVVTPFFVVNRIRQRDLWWLLWLPLSIGWLVVLFFYLDAMPLCVGILIPFWRWLNPLLVWRSGQAELPFLWLCQTIVVGLLLLATAASARKSSPTFTYLSVIALLLFMGFFPAGFQTRQYSVCLLRIPNLDPIKVEQLVGDVPARKLMVIGYNDFSKPDLPIMVKPGQLVVVQFDPQGEQPFFLRNCRRFADMDETILDKEHFVEGTFDHPCGMKSDYMIRVKPHNYPIHPDLLSLSVSTNVVRLGRYACQPVLARYEAYVAIRGGELQIGFNVPRGADGYINDNADGVRNFRIKVCDLPPEWLKKHQA